MSSCVESPPTAALTSDVGFILPKLRLEMRNMQHKGSHLFLAVVGKSGFLEALIQQVLGYLYGTPNNSNTTPPIVRSITFIIREMATLAYATGTDLDNDRKEINMSLHYISGVSPDLQPTEIAGVLCHELTHCLQYNGLGTANGGLIEGIADWVRLHCQLAPPHWTRKPGDTWDAGYEKTAYFLDFLVSRFGPDTMRRMNEKLRTDKYDEELFWPELLGQPVSQLWDDYLEHVKLNGTDYPLATAIANSKNPIVKQNIPQKNAVSETKDHLAQDQEIQRVLEDSAYDSCTVVDSKNGDVAGEGLN